MGQRSLVESEGSLGAERLNPGVQPVLVPLADSIRIVGLVVHSGAQDVNWIHAGNTDRCRYNRQSHVGPHCTGVNTALPSNPLQLVVRNQLRPGPEDPTKGGDAYPFRATSPSLLLDHLCESCPDARVSVLVSRLPAEGLHANLEHLNRVDATSSQSSTEHTHPEALIGLRRSLSPSHLMDRPQHRHEQTDTNTVKEELSCDSQLQPALQASNTIGLEVPLHTVDPTVVRPRLATLRQLIV
mmetsp:Transcript_68839/g.183352  ORF Transcript_68839/g.183352 Transcript_68839/m.183352 type:complete len:241 (-) Transcript_68839:161-883(-)